MIMPDDSHPFILGKWFACALQNCAMLAGILHVYFVTISQTASKPLEVISSLVSGECYLMTPSIFKNI